MSSSLVGGVTGNDNANTNLAKKYERIRKLDDIGFKWNAYKRPHTYTNMNDYSTADIGDE